MTEMQNAIIKSDRRGRLRFTPEQRTALLDAYDASGLSGPKFAQLHGVNYQTFAGWLQRRKRVGSERPARSGSGMITFVEADLSATGSGPALEVRLPGGITMLVGNRTQLAFASALIRDLQQSAPC